MMQGVHVPLYCLLAWIVFYSTHIIEHLFLFRVAAADSSNFEAYQLPQNGNLSFGGRPRAFGLMTENGVEVRHGVGGNKYGPLKPADATVGYVNTNDSPKRKSSELQIVNNSDREHLFQACK